MVFFRGVVERMLRIGADSCGLLVFCRFRVLLVCWASPVYAALCVWRVLRFPSFRFLCRICCGRSASRIGLAGLWGHITCSQWQGTFSSSKASASADTICRPSSWRFGRLGRCRLKNAVRQSCGSRSAILSGSFYGCFRHPLGRRAYLMADEHTLDCGSDGCPFQKQSVSEF